MAEYNCVAVGQYILDRPIDHGLDPVPLFYFKAINNLEVSFCGAHVNVGEFFSFIKANAGQMSRETEFHNVKALDVVAIEY